MEFEELSNTSHMSFNQLLHQVFLTDDGVSQLFTNQCAQPTNSMSHDFTETYNAPPVSPRKKLCFDHDLGME
ncbi:hypothetical protein GIB67_016462 [Kingdonia uniflora]|uniref:Uncharacterized protein n=1 Tax=Kingdonia uniflora TaxID=39325 RepID=A0A7J7M876_9MAGN|nr:hypothetical protein GIB67_016462 [Kingdonia uniflora]